MTDGRLTNGRAPCHTLAPTAPRQLHPLVRWHARGASHPDNNSRRLALAGTGLAPAAPSRPRTRARGAPCRPWIHLVAMSPSARFAPLPTPPSGASPRSSWTLCSPTLPPQSVRSCPLGSPCAHRTPRISCEAVPASNPAGAGMSRHLHPRNGAGESFVSFIRLFCGSTPTQAGPRAMRGRRSDAARIQIDTQARALPVPSPPLLRIGGSPQVPGRLQPAWRPP